MSLVLEPVVNRGMEVVATMARGHHPDRKIRGAALSDRETLSDFLDGDKGAIFRGRVVRTWISERKVRGEEWGTEYLEVPEDQQLPGDDSEPVTLLVFDSTWLGFRTLAQAALEGVLV